MPRFFVSDEQLCCDGEYRMVRLTGEDAHHIARSLRMAVGQHITLCDRAGKEYDCELIAFDDDRVVEAKICSERILDTEPPIRMTLYQALPKGDKLDTIIQKAVECGACRIVPFESTNCVVKVKEDTEARKQERRCKIAAEAAKQCRRGILPPVEATVSFSQMLAEAAMADLALFCYEGEGTIPLQTLLRSKRMELPQDRPATVAIIIGSEGGFSQQEVEKAKKCSCVPIGLGPRILRTETASCFVLSALIYEFEL